MEFSAQFDVIGPILQICLIDLLLSGDNAVLIAMAARGLDADLRMRAVVLGTAAAILFRVVLTFAATLALRAPYLKLIGALLLLLIAIELLASNSSARSSAGARPSGASLWRAITIIVAADAVMSLDNVVAVAAAAQDNLGFLLLGLLLSIPILVFSSLYIARLLDAFPVVVQAGAALLGWIAGRTAVSDPALARFLETQSFGLVASAPLFGALYVLVQGRLLAAAPARPLAAPAPLAGAPAAQPRPAPRPAPVAAPLAATVPPQAAAPAAAAVEAAGMRRFAPMDLAILAGVAVPLLGLLGMLGWFLVRAFSGH